MSELITEERTTYEKPSGQGLWLAFSCDKLIKPQAIQWQGSLENVVWTQATVIEGDSFAADRRAMLLARNTGVEAHTLVVYSARTPAGRRADLELVVQPQALSMWAPATWLGWAQPDGKIYMEADSEEIALAIVRLP